MNATIPSTQKHIHLDFDLDRDYEFHYRSQGRDGHRVILHRGDSITFTGSDEFAIQFAGRSPFEETVLRSRHSFVTAQVRNDAANGAYEYGVEVEKDDQLFTDPRPGRACAARLEIVVESGE